ncbi:unnamed protein product [Didymodactylos carnosus]|uniref:Helix-turn-helix domain-containing protein n=1 Tax=Didymodactylos carnosus TaxID=1234261 RepID=A0A814JBY6_9BILA|nr:unnamed protein product [Didymodactylos carnosus]CAF3806576.1 unnamed protein product [Didymodactylos carnosus]
MDTYGPPSGSVVLSVIQMTAATSKQKCHGTLNELELKLAGNQTNIAGQSVVNAIKAYMVYRTERIKEGISQKITHFHQIIAQRRQRSSTAKKATGVSPQVTIDVLHHAPTDDELNYISIEQRWIRRQDHNNEIYGRYIDDVFFTSNEHTETVQQLLTDANSWDDNIKSQGNIGMCVPFLDVLICNNRGSLYTSVCHKPSAEPYVLPFLSDHPRNTFANVIQTALVRAIRYSSTYQIFNIERRTIELMLLYNG